jgi:cell division septation protein DedD
MRNDQRNRAEPQFGYDGQPPKGPSNRDSYPVLEGSPRRRRRSLLLVTITGIVVILFAGALWISYTGHKRGPNGEPPVIAADTTPVKVKPDQPGGMSIPYQDTTVYDQLATGKQKPEPGVEHLLQPPEQPLPKPLPAPEAPAALPAPNTEMAAAAEPPPATFSSDPAALAPPPAMITAPPPAVAPPATLSVVNSAPVPPPKPLATAPAITHAAATSAPLPSPAPTPASVGTGFMLQLGAFHDEATANSDWQSAKAAHPAELGALHPTVEPITINDKTLYRLKAGPIGEAQARQNCASLKAANVVCIVVPQ